MESQCGKHPKPVSLLAFFGYCAELTNSTALTDWAVNLYWTLQDRQGPASDRFDSNLSHTKAQQAHGRGQ
jgi:hypothetical protein